MSVINVRCYFLNQCDSSINVNKSNKRHSIIAFIAKSIGKIQIGKKKEHLRGMHNKG